MSRRTARTPSSALRLGTDRDGRILAIGHDVVSGNLRTEQTYEGSGPSNADALRRCKPADPPSSGAAGHCGGVVHARTRRGCGAARPGMCDGRARREARPRSDRIARAQRADRGSGKAHSVLQPPSRSPATRKGRGALAGTSAIRSRAGSRRTLARGYGGRGRHARQPAAAFEGQCAVGTGRFRHRANGDDRHRHRQLHHSHPDRRGNARLAAGPDSDGAG